MNRWRDWWDQSTRDLAHARHALDSADFEWAAFAAQQSAEKAVKALALAEGDEPWGHLVTALVESLPPAKAATPDVLDAPPRQARHSGALSKRLR